MKETTTLEDPATGAIPNTEHDRTRPRERDRLADPPAGLGNCQRGDPRARFAGRPDVRCVRRDGGPGSEADAGPERKADAHAGANAGSNAGSDAGSDAGSNPDTHAQADADADAQADADTYAQADAEADAEADARRRRADDVALAVADLGA
jgi:hypothetical protein